jgi:hypothetical protein
VSGSGTGQAAITSKYRRLWARPSCIPQSRLARSSCLSRRRNWGAGHVSSSLTPLLTRPLLLHAPPDGRTISVGGSCPPPLRTPADLHEPSRQSHFSWRRVIAAVIVLVALAGAAIVVLPRPWVTLSSSERRSETAATEDIPQTRALGDAARRGPLAPHAAKKLHPQTATARAAIGHATTLHRQRATVAAAATRRPLAPSRARPATTAAMVGKGPFLTWSARPGGSRYWVDLTIVRSHGEQVLLTFMTEEPRLRVPTSWYNAGRRLKLVRAHYRWYVWRSERAMRMGSSAAPLASGEFTIR